MALVDPLDEASAVVTKKDSDTKLVDPLDSFRGPGQNWGARPKAAEVKDDGYNPAADQSFLQNMGVGAVEATKELGTGANLWGQRAFAALGPGVARDTLAQNERAEAERRKLYEPVKETFGYKIGSGAPYVGASMLVPPSGLASYGANAALSMLPEIDPANAAYAGLASVPGTALGNLIGSVTAKGTNTLLGRVDPNKVETVAADKLLRQNDGLGLPYTSFKTTPARVADFDATVMKAHPVAALDRIKAAGEANDEQAWNKVYQIAKDNEPIIDIDLTKPIDTLKNFRDRHGTSVLTKLDEPKDVAAILYMVGNKQAAKNTLNRTLSDADRADPNVTTQFFANVQAEMNGASFEASRRLQQRIGNAIGQLSRDPEANRAALSALRAAYKDTLTAMENTGNKTVDKQLTEALREASKIHREEVMPFRTGEVNGATSTILNRYNTGVYKNAPSQILTDMSVPSNREGFGQFVYPKLSAEEAAAVQKIIAEPKLARQVRQGAEPAPGGNPNPVVHPIEWAKNTDALRYSPILKRIIAANPNLGEGTAFQPVTRGGMGGLRALANAAAPGLIDKASNVSLNPLDWFKDKNATGAAFVPYANQAADH